MNWTGDGEEDEWPDTEPDVGRGPLRVVGPEDESPLIWKGKKLAQVASNGTILLVQAPEWSGLRWNKFRGETSVGSPPVLQSFDPPTERLDSYSASYISHWLGMRRGLVLGESETIRAAEHAAKSKGRAFHPVRDYLNGLSWDGVARLDRFAETHLGAIGTPYTSAVWRLWMISAVARVMSPGCQVHHVPILEGKQGSGKSTAIRALSPQSSWINDSPIKIGDRDGMDALRGHWIVEFAELESLSGRESSKVKSFLTSAVDTYRKAYGKETEKVPRQCVMIGTVNPEEGYLQDPTGNRRFWPIKTGDIRVDDIERDRDQLWAEALSYYTDGAAWHMTDRAIVELAMAEQQHREAVDPWEETILAGLDAPYRRPLVAMGVTTSYVLTDVLTVPTKEHSRLAASRVGTILRKNGWTTRGGHRPRRYYAPDTQQTDDDSWVDELDK